MRSHGRRSRSHFPGLRRSGESRSPCSASARWVSRRGSPDPLPLTESLSRTSSRHIDELRERDLREAEKRWLAEGVSPVEQAWSALRRSHGPEADGPPSELDAQLGRMIQARCDRVWDGIRDRRYVKQRGRRDQGHRRPRHFRGTSRRCEGSRPAVREGCREGGTRCAHRRHRVSRTVCDR